MLKDKASREKGVRALVQSDIELRKRPGSWKLWEWDKSHVIGDTVFFGVNWYDREFFESRKEAFLDSNHARYYAEFGATADNFTVTHTIV